MLIIQVLQGPVFFLKFSDFAASLLCVFSHSQQTLHMFECIGEFMLPHLHVAQRKMRCGIAFCIFLLGGGATVIWLGSVKFMRKIEIYFDPG